MSGQNFVMLAFKLQCLYDDHVYTKVMQKKHKQTD